jgi:hypothetical protein
MSGASEATLQELLQVNRDMASAISKLAGASGGSGGGGGGGGAANKASGMLGKSFETLGKGAGMVTGIFGTMMKPALMAATAGFSLLVSSGKTLFANQMALADGAIAGTNSLASLTAGLEQLPGILGFAMKAYNFQIKKMEANLKTYDEISTVGARFGGSLEEMRSGAKNSYLSLDEFAQVMKAAGPQLRFMGTSSEEGARNLVKFNSTMIKGEVGKGLLGMGYSLTEANAMLATYSESVGGLKASQMKDQKEMEKSVKFFAEELDAAAQLEGKTRQQKEEEMKQASQQAAVRAKLSEMGPEEQKKYLAAYNAALRVGGKGAAEALQSQLLGLPPMTKAAQQFTAVNGEAAATVKQLGDTVTDGSKAVDARSKIDKLANQGVAQSAKMYKDLGVTGAALSMSQGGYADTVNAGAKNLADMNNLEAKSAEDLDKRTAKIRAEQDTAQKSNIGALKQQQGAAKYAGEAMMDLYYKALKPLIDIILMLNEKFLEVLPAIAQFTADVINKGLVVLTSIFKAIDWSAVKTSFMGAWKMLTETFGNIYDAVGKAVGGSGGIGGLLSKGMTMFFDTMKSIIEVVGVIVVKFVQSNLFQTLKTFMLSMWDLIKVLVDAVVEIVKSPVGMFVIDVIFDTFDILFTIVNKLIEGVKAAVTLIVQVVKSVTTDFSESWKKIKDYVMNLINTVSDWFKSIPKKINDFFGEGNLLEKVFDALKGIIGGIVDGIKAIGSKIVNFFKSSDATPSGPTAPQTANAPNASNMPPMTETAKKMAEENAKKNAPTVTANNNGNVPVVQPKSNDPVEILRAEIQTLNNITSEMLKAMRDTRDYSKSTANTLASNGNLFKRA